MQTMQENTEGLIDGFLKRMQDQGHSDKVDSFWLRGLQAHAKRIDQELERCNLAGVISHAVRYGFHKSALLSSLARKEIWGMSEDPMFAVDDLSVLIAAELAKSCDCKTKK